MAILNYPYLNKAYYQRVFQSFLEYKCNQAWKKYKSK